MQWKNLLYALLGVLLPMLYSAIASKFPGFPLAEADFVALVLWAIGLLVGGWQLSNYAKLRAIAKKGCARIGNKFLVGKNF